MGRVGAAGSGTDVDEASPERAVADEGRAVEAELRPDAVDIRRARLRTRGHARGVAGQEVVDDEGDRHDAPNHEKAPRKSAQQAAHGKTPPSARSSPRSARSSHTPAHVPRPHGVRGEPADVRLADLVGMVGVRERPRCLVAEDLVRFAVHRSPRGEVGLSARSTDQVVEPRVRIERGVGAPLADGGGRKQGIEERARVGVVHFPIRLRHRRAVGPLLEREERRKGHELELDPQPDARQVLLEQLRRVREQPLVIERVHDGRRPAAFARRGIEGIPGPSHVLERRVEIMALPSRLRLRVEAGRAGRDELGEHRHVVRLERSVVVSIDGRRHGAADLDIVERGHARVHRFAVGRCDPTPRCRAAAIASPRRTSLHRPVSGRATCRARRPRSESAAWRTVRGRSTRRRPDTATPRRK